MRPKLALLLAIGLHIGVSSAYGSETSLTFDAWSAYTNWSTATNADGWIIRNAEIRDSRGWATPFSLALAGWLCDYEYSADAWIMSPLQTGGVGRIVYYCRKWPSTPATNTFEVQWSTNLSDWLSVATTFTLSDTWIPQTNIFMREEAGYVRFIKTGDGLSVTSYLGFDSIRIDPPGAIPPPPPPPTVSNNIAHILGTGQSLSMGYAGAPPLTTNQPYANLMLKGTWQTNMALTPLIETTNNENSLVETISSAMANTLTHLSDGESFRSIVTRHGRSGTAYSGIKKGTVYYRIGMDQVSNAMAMSMATGLAYNVGAVTVVHGESDHIAGLAGQYEGYLYQWRDDYDRDAKAITGQTNDVPMFLCQMSAFTMWSSTTSGIPLAQLSATEKSRRHFLVCPKYFFVYSDGVHLNNLGYRWLGEYYGKALKTVLVDGREWQPLKPGRITMTGAVITVDLHVPVPPVVIDTNQVLYKINYGFEYTDSTASASITNVWISGPAQITIELNQAPGGANPRLGYAWSGAIGSQGGARIPGSARGNIRDSDATPSLYSNSLPNWLVQFQYPIPTDIERDDLDDDGLADRWEYRWLGDTNAGTATDDPDGDGMNNRDECITGNNPMVSNAPPRVAIGKSTNTSGLVLSLDTTKDRLYTIERSDDELSSPTWHSVTSWTANGRLAVIEDADQAKPEGYFRLTVTNPPSY